MDCCYRGEEMVWNHLHSMDTGLVPFFFDESSSSLQSILITDFFTVVDDTETGPMPRIIVPGVYEVRRVRNDGFSEGYDFLVFTGSALRVNLERLKSKRAWYETKMRPILECALVYLLKGVG